jgi:hypothetical protein
MTARLTPETARVGMRVVCVDARGGFPDDRLTVGSEYEITGIHTRARSVALAGNPLAWKMDRFIPAEPASPALPALTPELLEALRWVYRDADGVKRDYMRGSTRALIDAIEAAPGILAPVAPTLPAMWCGADAFEGEG